MTTKHVKGENMWMRCFQPCPSGRVRLICFPHAGGSATYYFPYSQSLAPEIETWAVQYPGRQDRRREPLIDNIQELADRIYAELSTELSRPFAFFGHSMGAVVAFEVAQRLKEQDGISPVWLGASGRRAPSHRREENVHQRDDAGLIAEMRRVGGTNQLFLQDEELLAAILPVTRNDYRAIETYRWADGPALDCPVTALVGDSDPQTTTAEAAGWAAHTTEPFELSVFPGGHFYLDSQRAAVLDTISTALLGVPRTTSVGGSTK